MVSTLKWYRAPGRVNLIGEHTDYNEGLVMPAAIALSAWVGYAPRDNRSLLVRSERFPDTLEIDLDRPPAPGSLVPHWGNALRGIAALLGQSEVKLRGAEIEIRSEVPMGAGLSSSAAVEVAFGYALAAEAGGIDRTELALLCQHANHLYTGIRCGIMDQYIACHGRRGFAMMLDTRDLTSTPLPLPDNWRQLGEAPGKESHGLPSSGKRRAPAERPAGATYQQKEASLLRLVVCDTMVRHDHSAGEYNRRRAECEAGVEILARRTQGLRSLRDVSLEDLERSAADLGPLLLRRCRHVVTENARVLAAAEALKQYDFGRLGRLLAGSHASLRDDYEVSCRELDIMCELASWLEGVVGARMTGGGFGGSVLALVCPEFVDTVRERLAESYRSATGIAPEIRAFTTANGVEASANPSTPSL